MIDPKIVDAISLILVTGFAAFFRRHIAQGYCSYQRKKLGLDCSETFTQHFLMIVFLGSAVLAAVWISEALGNN